MEEAKRIVEEYTPKAYAIARSPSGRRWVGVISWAESNVAFARAKALSQCRQIASGMWDTCEIRDAQSELPPLLPYGKPQPEYFPTRFIGLTHKSVLSQEVVDNDIEKCEADDNLRIHDGVSFINKKFIN